MKLISKNTILNPSKLILISVRLNLLKEKEEDFNEVVKRIDEQWEGKNSFVEIDYKKKIKIAWWKMKRSQVKDFRFLYNFIKDDLNIK